MNTMIIGKYYVVSVQRLNIFFVFLLGFSCTRYLDNFIQLLLRRQIFVSVPTCLKNVIMVKSK